MNAKLQTETTASPSSAVILAAAIGIAACAILPIALVRFPPINDYPFHLARTLILANLDNALFERFYDLGSFLVPNLAMDAVAFLLAQAMAPETAARSFVGLSLLVMLAGTVALHWSIRRRFSPWPLLAVVFLHNGIFRFGFFNYLFGLGLAFLAAAIWNSMRPGLQRNLLGFVFACLLMLCHMEAFGVFAVIAGSLELYRSATSVRDTGWAREARNLVLSSLPFAAAVVLFFILSPTANVTSQGFAYSSHLGAKPYGILYSLSSGILWLDAVTAATLAALVAWLGLTRQLAVSRPLAFAASMMALTIVLLPTSMMGSLYLDTRLGPALVLLLIAASDVRIDRNSHTKWIILAVICSLAALRTGTLYPQWLSTQREITPIVESFNFLEPGATLFAATAEPYPRLLAAGSERRAAWQPPLKHVASYAVLKKAVFVPMTWADPTKQPLVVSPAFLPVKRFQGNNPTKVPDRPSFDRLIAKLSERLQDKTWPDLSDTYLLLVGSDRLLPLNLPSHVQTVVSGKRHVLLRFQSSERRQ